MNNEYSEYSNGDSKMEEDNINSNEKLLNADDEYQEGRVPVQMLFKEKALRYASPYSLLCDDDEDVYGRTTESVKNASIEVNNFPLSSRDIFQTEYHETGERKKVRRRMIVSAGLMGVILVAMVTTSSFTLPHTPLSEKNNITSNSYFNFTEVSSTIGNKSAPEFEELANKHRIAAEQGDAEAQFHLGYMYENGQGVNQSDEEAIKWYNLAAEQGLAHAKTGLGRMHFKRTGGNQSEEEALKWYRNGAERGDADAQNNLGKMYHGGVGVNQSDEEAVKWYRKAAEQGDADAQYNLGWMYQRGHGVNQSYDEAAGWFRKAADQDHVNAQYNLGWMFRNGRGVPQSEEEAMKWYAKALEQENSS